MGMMFLWGTDENILKHLEYLDSGMVAQLCVFTKHQILKG